MTCRLHVIKYYSSQHTKQNQTDGECDTYGWEYNVYRVPVGGSQGKRPLGALKHKGKNNIKIYINRLG